MGLLVFGTSGALAAGKRSSVNEACGPRSCTDAEVQPIRDLAVNADARLLLTAYNMPNCAGLSTGGIMSAPPAAALGLWQTVGRSWTAPPASVSLKVTLQARRTNSTALITYWDNICVQ